MNLKSLSKKEEFKEEEQMVSEELPVIEKLTASQMVQKFLKDNNITQKITILKPDQSSWVGDGFVLTDQPLLKVTYEYIN